ncbi:MAG: undecaprenyl/decaprenyl-phosphate alpha-N-acetylglucosaminyl 1-phosphate transferase [Actinobacteria bacterium]|nr:MAG: undecaprenyl/decaprenyl-phosphate alpha-N-acetylglucosaminyl 1-phosphate transferase [Actinomycetota bacterium]
MTPYLGVFAVTALAVLAVTPGVRWLAVKIGAIDRPSDRKVHPKPTPTLGGLGIFFGLAAGLAVAYLFPDFRRLYRQTFELQGTFLAALAITVVGLVDDVHALSAPAKAAGQILAAGLLILYGVELLFFWFPTQGVISLGPDLAVPLTVLWVLMMVNAVNLIDGLDGLAAGIVAIAAAAFFVWVYVSPSSFPESAKAAALLCAIAAGAGLGFLPYNFYPARIFMGDSGAMLLGLLLAAATIAGVGRTLQPHGGDVAAFAIPILIPVFVLAVPLTDVALAVVRRIRRGRPVFAPDKEHIHHQLRDIGHTHRRAVLIMYYWAMLLAGSGLAVSFINGRLIVGSIILAALGLIAATFVPRRLRESRRLRRLRKAEALAEPRARSGQA